ncbi:helix-turn-helix domain-containing protein [Myroides injenensis]|uniref:helix-turn-helix domain-containing protein n=1 Tax=Myroides injenensis TaxID=1183151 RepID=UPI0002884322|nr:AraC family transcriptional regulator [Myroides injenensis]
MNTEKESKTRNEEITNAYFKYITNHIDDVVSAKVSEFEEINQIASNLAISHKHLIAVIQGETGHHPCYFYDQKIIDKAKELLVNSHYSVAEIARMFTYDPSNFSKFFKKLTQLTPGQFRSQHK